MKTHRNSGQPGQSITRHVYGTGAAVLAEYSVNPSTDEETALRWFVHGESFPEPLAMVDVSAAGDNSTPGAEEFLYYLTDVQGSVGALTNAVGQVVERYFYTPYGQTTITAADGTTPRTESLYGNPFAYTAQRYESQTGLYHFWARVYSPTLGRFLARDRLGALDAGAGQPVFALEGRLNVSDPGFGPGDEYADGMNLHQYVGAAPTLATDPTGQFQGFYQMVADITVSVTAAYAFGMDAGVFSLLEDDQNGFDLALQVMPYAVQGAAAGGLAAFGFGYSPGGNILAGAIAGGFTSYGMGQGWASGASAGATSAAFLEVLFAGAGKMARGMVAGGSAIAGASRRLLNRVLRGRGYVSTRVPGKAYAVLAHVCRTGSPPAGYAGGRVFKNREGKLPSGRYREYDVDPRPSSGGTRNAERIVVEQGTGDAWYTPDHYDTFSPM